MLQQDMTGYTKGTTDNGSPEVVGVITDYVDRGLTTFITHVIDAVSPESLCDYASRRLQFGHSSPVLTRASTVILVTC